MVLMINFNDKFLNILYAGIFLLSACIIGSGISSTNIYSEKYYDLLVIPKIISYILIFTGALGYINIFNLITKKRKG